MILFSNANLTTQTLSSVMSNLLSVTKHRDDSNRDRIMFDKSHLQIAVDLRKAVGGRPDEATVKGNLDKVFSTRYAPV